jgi:hypothetical protein
MRREERTPDDFMKAADEAMEVAEVLAGQGKISDQGFLERLARGDRTLDHDGETCGMCCNMMIGAQVAREMLQAGEYEDVVSKWAAEARQRWEKTKFFKLWQREQKAGATRARRSRNGDGSRDCLIPARVPTCCGRTQYRQAASLAVATPSLDGPARVPCADYSLNCRAERVEKSVTGSPPAPVAAFAR